MGYQWDPKKAASNLEKHGVDFAERQIYEQKRKGV
jgi:uncharacterized DUF497 family protein